MTKDSSIYTSGLAVGWCAGVSGMALAAGQWPVALILVTLLIPVIVLLKNAGDSK